tara:strand:+ start:6581 stop:7825 length:1245 start_codon:yes stop_codon:yes gene_type:complete
MFNSENAQKKWAPLLEHSDVAPIKDPYRKAVTATLLENQEKALREQASHSSFSINEANDTATGNVNNFDPVLIALVRRAMPSLIAYDVAGVQPMSGPTGLIFSMVAKYGANAHSQATTEALFDKANTAFSGDSPGTGLPVSEGESLSGTGTGTSTMSAMGFEIKKASVEAKTRALKAGYTMELAQDLKAIHGLDAESELANILSTEILAEINREMIKEIQYRAVSGTAFSLNDTANNLGARWGQEKFQALVFRIEQEANAIGVATRRGKGNFVIVSPAVGSALAASGYLNYGDAVKENGLSVDAQVNTFAGVLNGSLKVYVDPYFDDSTDADITVGYRGASPYDAGMFYCPYVPLTMVKAVGEEDFQPRIAFKTRYGMVANPYALTYAATGISQSPLGKVGTNPYFRTMQTTDI